MMWGWGWGAGLMFLWMALFWVGVVLLSVWAVRQFAPNNRPTGNRALEILDERYARGEIEREEFESRRRDLRGEREMRDARLFCSGLALVAVAVLGGTVTIGFQPGGMGWPNPMGFDGPMMELWQDGADSSSQPIPGATELTLDADEFGFLPMAVTVDDDVPVNLTLVNTGSLVHDLTIPELGFRVVAIAGQLATGGLVPDRPGTFAFQCSIPGHAQAGMTGTLVVKAAP